MIRTWDVNSGSERQTLDRHTSTVRSVALSPDGMTFASGSGDCTVQLWHVGTGEQIKTLMGHSGGVSSVTFSFDGKTLASASLDGTVKLWDMTFEQPKDNFGGGYRGENFSFAVSPGWPDPRVLVKQ